MKGQLAPNAELYVVAIALLGIVLMIAPIAGIRHAATRHRNLKVSTSAVVLAGIGTLASGLFALAQMSLYPICIALANLVWLTFAVHTNRSVSRRIAREPRPTHSSKF